MSGLENDWIVLIKSDIYTKCFFPLLSLIVEVLLLNLLLTFKAIEFWLRLDAFNMRKISSNIYVDRQWWCKNVYWSTNLCEYELIEEMFDAACSF